MHVAYLHYLWGRDTALHHVHQFADAARALGHRVDVHAMNLAPPPLEGGGGGGPVPWRRRLRAGLKRRFGRWLHDPKELAWNLRYLRRESALLRPEPPDVLLVRSHGLGVSCVPVARRLGLPLVLEINAPSEETATYQRHYVPWTRTRRWAGRYKLRHADAITVVSGALGDHYAERLGVQRDRLHVVPNGADLERFHPDVPPDPRVASDRGQPGDDQDAAPWIGYVGSFQAWHALDRLATLVETVARSRPSSRFLMVGDGPGLERLRALDLPPPRLVCTGRVEHARVPGLVAALDIGVLAEIAWYQCPLKVIEWMAAGTAIVAPGHPPLHELLRDGEEGLLFPPGDLEAAIRQVERLVDDPALRRRLGAAAARKAHASLGWRHNAERMLDACRAAATHHAARRPATGDRQ
ncbi:MAG: glycosyltransferase family 4 protein [Acidobacteriota bacterium]